MRPPILPEILAQFCFRVSECVGVKEMNTQKETPKMMKKKINEKKKQNKTFVSHKTHQH